MTSCRSRATALAAQVAALGRLRARRRCRTTCSPATRRAWIYDGVSVNPMAKPARLREAVHLDAIYRHHPLFADASSRGLERRHRRGAATLEGGDVLVIGNGAVLVGMGERTRPAAVELLAGGCSPPAPPRSVIAVEHARRSARRCTWTR